MIEKEELKRMVERPGLTADGKPMKLTKRKRVKRVAQKVVGGIFSRTVGRVGRFASRRLLGRVPETALEGSFQEEKSEEENKLLNAASKTPQVPSETEVERLQIVSKEADEELVKDQDILAKEISDQIFLEYNEESGRSNPTHVSDSDMKSDSQLFKEVMDEKSRISSVV